MFDKLRKSTQSLPTPAVPPAQREDIPYWATLKSIYLASLTKKDDKKVTRRLRRQKKRSNQVHHQEQQPTVAHPRRYPVEIVGRLPPDGIPRPPSFIYTAPIKRFQIPQSKTHFYVEDPFSANSTQSTSEYYSRNSRYSHSTNSDDPFGAHLSQFFPENARVSGSHYPRYYRPSIVHPKPIIEDASPEKPLPSPNRLLYCESTAPIESISVDWQESAPQYCVYVRPRRQTASQYPSKSDEEDTPSVIPLAPVPEHVRHPRNYNHLPCNILTSPTTSICSPETLLGYDLSSRTIPARPPAPIHLETTSIEVDRSSYHSEASVYSQASMIPCCSPMHSRLNRLSSSTVVGMKEEIIGTSEQEIDEWQSYGKEIIQDDDPDSEDDSSSEDGSDSDSTYDGDSNSISPPSSVSSVETAFFSCSSETGDNNNNADNELTSYLAEKTVIHKARMDVLAVAQALRETQDEHTSEEIKFREDVVTGLAHVLTEVADNKTKQRQIVPLRCRSTQTFMSLSLDEDCSMPGAFTPVPSGRGRSASTAKLL
ncbi:hypothetical protein Clacol_007861 [Clathrus columnatus]|uniref:Uncharacterized protein n=1 Tax=Clathrus columnatus TaxID=1419009 RepID=A0AAV5AGX4_9AGAM|nr:hypothetical protein Clacol_007861 [Clathrus columnatus]